MTEAAVTSKGQVTIPSEIRRAMGLSEKDRVVFTVMPDGTTVMRAKSRSIVEVKGVVSEVKNRVRVASMRLG